MGAVPERKRQTGAGTTLLLAALLGVVLLAARLPFRNHPTPTHPDETSFVAAVGFPADYPVHAPGYPLWVAIGTILRPLCASPYNAYALASLSASIAGPLLLFAWLRPANGNRLAWLTALALGLCPLAWFHAVTALTYWMATLIAIAVVMACERAIANGGGRSLTLAAALLGIGVFLRTDCLIYFGPLFAWAAIRTTRSRARLAVVIPVIAVASFYVLMRYLYGRAGVDVFAQRFDHSREVLLGTSLFGAGFIDGLVRNLVKLLVNLGWNVGPLGLALVVAFVMKRKDADVDDAAAASEAISPRIRSGVIALWLATGLTFLALFHVVEGYFLWVLPGAFAGAAGILQRRLGQRRAIGVMALAIAVSVGQFLIYPWSADSDGLKRTLDAKIGYLTARGLMHINERERIHNDGDVWRIPAHDHE